jgi:arabinose-5-phosphate isomerase
MVHNMSTCIQDDQTLNCLEIARSVMNAESQAIAATATHLDDSLRQAVECLLAHNGKVIVSGIGKSGHVGQKIVSTLCSTGTPAVFLHAAEAYHGDLGVYTPGDPTILISKSGSTFEVLRLLPNLRHFQSAIIAIVGNLDSPLAHQADIVLDARVKREADRLNLAPTCSSAVSLAIGDALAVALMQARRFTERDFARYHPAGQLGRNLHLRVSEVMHQRSNVACVNTKTSLREVIIAMTQHPLGAACVISEDFVLLGLITDGDLRRGLLAYEDIRPLRAMDIMSLHPIIISRQASLKEATDLMESRPSQISVLPVVDPQSNQCLGLVRIHDIFQPMQAVSYDKTNP